MPTLGFNFSPKPGVIVEVDPSRFNLEPVTGALPDDAGGMFYRIKYLSQLGERFVVSTRRLTPSDNVSASVRVVDSLELAIQENIDNVIKGSEVEVRLLQKSSPLLAIIDATSLS